VANLYSKIERYKQFIKFFIEKNSPVCGICAVKLSWKSFFPKLSGYDRDDLTQHHKNHNRANDTIENKCLVHRTCHRQHHRNMQILKNNGSKQITYYCYENRGGKTFKEKYIINAKMI